jgi:aminoglycoside phosphotransferase (APT) family kinase protein
VAAHQSLDELKAALTAFHAREAGVPASEVFVTHLARLAGGASRLLWALDLEISGQKRQLVVRQDPPGRISAGGMEIEFRLLREAAAAGVPVPAVHACEPTGEVIGAPFFTMDRLPGETIPRRLLRDERYRETRARLTSELGAILARIHRIDPLAPALAGRMPAPAAGRSPAELEIERISQGLRAFAVEPHPALDLAERWLRAHAPACTRPRFVHGDYRVGNVMFDERGVMAILDWELAHIGDPIEDLGWLCVRAWRFGNDRLPVGGVGTREALVAAYQAESGESVDLGALRFWEVCGSYKLALVFVTQARAYLDGAHRTVELASLGRRTAEAEEELLRLIREAA